MDEDPSENLLKGTFTFPEFKVNTYKDSLLFGPVKFGAGFARKTGVHSMNLDFNAVNNLPFGNLGDWNLNMIKGLAPLGH